ncbi:TatD family hydrolase [Nesterenkonia alba]|uniref:TatD family hydrolase n=1 Tax=Nesterenkonia alba TaxID=515814 RepID=UPI001FE21ADB|nr:TatD family hydrolase [Nesterenkonia alba]
MTRSSDQLATEVTPGQIPPAYLPGETGSDPQSARSADGPPADGPVRSEREENSGSRRRLEYPPAPQPLPVPVVDNHAHLDFRDGQVAVTVTEHLDTAQALGAAGAVLVGYDVASSEFSVAAAADEPRAKAAVALHPNEAPVLAEEGTYDAAFSRITELASAEHVVAIGETGLDYFRTGEDRRAAQHASFRDHLALAAERGLPVQIHDRDAHTDVVNVLSDTNQLPPAVVLHCFSGDAELARICNERGWYMSFAGTVTFKNAQPLRDALAIADPQLILVETDCPFLTPHPYRGQPNAPYMVAHTMRLMAEVRAAELGQLCQQVMFNTTQVYGEWT